jgi:hypothetical protein
MSSVRSIDLARLPEIRRSLADWLERAREEFHLEAAFLFGSFARGAPHEGSDIDLVLIGPFTGKLPYRIARVLASTDLPIQPLCYTNEEWEAMLAAGNAFALEVKRSGKAVLPPPR